MSTSRESVGNGNGVQPIPASSRKIVQSLKEITSCSEAEIYATLKDCNMDPDEAVNRLISQDHFHEVKSKREKKKEGKDTSEGRPHGTVNSSTQGSKSVGHRYLGRGVSTHFSGRAHMSSLSSTNGFKRGRGPRGLSDGYSVNKGSSKVIGDNIPSGVQQSQSAWVSVSGQMSMADIVKMGGQNNKETSASNASHNNNIENDSTYHDSVVPFDSKVPREAYAEKYTSINQDYKAEEEDQETLRDNVENSPSISSREITDASISENSLYANMDPNRQQASEFEHEFENPGASVSSVTTNLQQLSVEKGDRELPSDGDDAPFLVIPDHLQVQIADCSHLSFGSYRSGLSITYSSGTIETNSKRQQSEADVSPVGHPDSRNYGYHDNSSRNTVNENSLHRTGASVGSYDAPSVSQKEELKPDPLDSRNYDYYSNSCRNAVNDNSFHGTGVSGASYDTPSALQRDELKPETVEINSERRQNKADISSSFPLDSRNYDYYSNNSSRNAVNDYPFHGTGLSGASYVIPLSQSEDLKPKNADVARGNQYILPNSNNGYNFVDIQHLKPAFPDCGPKMQDRASFSDMMSFKTAWPSSNTSEPQNHGAYSKPNKKFDLQQMHALNAKLGIFSSNVDGPPLTVSEALKIAATARRPAPQNLTSGSLFPLRPRARPTLAPLVRPYTNNTTDHPFLQPQSYGYMPPSTDFQQTVAGNSDPPYHQSINDTDFSYDDVSSSQYNDNIRHLIAQRQNNNENSSAMWGLQHGSNPRTMSTVPANINYQRQQQNRQLHLSEYRQGHQVSQNYGYPNFYDPQTGISLNQQPQNLRNGSLGGSQGQPKHSQFWSNNY